MPFVSDAQRKHFFANKGGGADSAGGEYNADAGGYVMTSDEKAAASRERNDGRIYDADYAITNGEARERGAIVKMPQMSEQEKVDWAAWRGDFGKK